MSRRGIPVSSSRTSVGGSRAPCPCPASAARATGGAAQSRLQPPRVSMQATRGSIGPPRGSMGLPRGSMGPPRSSMGAPGSRIQPPTRTLTAIPATGKTPVTRLSTRPVQIPKIVVQEPTLPTQPVYQKRSVTRVSSGYSAQPRPSLSGPNVVKTTRKTVEVKKTAGGPKKITKEVVTLRPAPPGARPGTLPLPAAPGEAAYLQTRRTSLSNRVSLAPPPRRTAPPKGPLGSVVPKSRLSQEVERTLIDTADVCPGKTITATGARQSLVRPPVVMTKAGPVSPEKQLIAERIVEKSPGIERVTRGLTSIEKLAPCTARKIELQLQELDATPGPHPSAPPKETVSVRRVVSIDESGKMDTDRSVTYERIAPTEKYRLSPAQVDRLINEETEDVVKSKNWKPIELVSTSPGSLPLKKKEHDLSLTTEIFHERFAQVIIPEQAPDEVHNDEVPPELIATILYTEEKGMEMNSEPAQIYTMLFPDDTELGPDVMEVNSAGPVPVGDVAVPSHPLPEAFYNNSITPDLEKVIMDTDGIGDKPSTAGYSNYQEEQRPGVPPADQAQAITDNIKTKHATRRAPQIEPVQPIEDEEPPWSPNEERLAKKLDEQMKELEMQQLRELRQIEANIYTTVGAGQAKEDLYQTFADAFSVGLPSPDAEEFMLHVEPPVYTSQVQLRGSTIPPWFPGYYIAFPEIPDIISTVKYPTFALSAAWKHTRPQQFVDESFLVI